MAISTYTDLQVAIADYLDRDDLTEPIKDFILLSETKLYRTLRIPVMEVTITLSTDGTTGKITIPTDFLELKGFALVDGDERVNLDRIAIDDVRTRNVRTGIPQHFARVNQEWVFDPFPDSVRKMEILYYKQLANLATTTNETNYFTGPGADALLYGALAEAYLFLKDVERFGLWNGRFKSALSQIQGFADQAEWAGSPMSVR